MRYLFLSVAIAFAATLSSCGEVSSSKEAPAEAEAKAVDPVAGIWKVTECTIDIPEMDEEMIEGAKALALSSTYYLAEDGSFKKFDDYLPDGLVGTWRNNEPTKELYFDFEFEGRPQSEIYNVVSVSPSELTLEQNVFKGSMRMVLRKTHI